MSDLECAVHSNIRPVAARPLPDALALSRPYPCAWGAGGAGRVSIPELSLLEALDAKLATPVAIHERAGARTVTPLPAAAPAPATPAAPCKDAQARTEQDACSLANYLHA
jgi:hypothetical protein